MPELSLLQQYIAAFAPTVVSVLSMVVAMAKIVSSAKKANQELKDQADFKEIKAQLNQVLSENVELKKQSRLLLEKITRVKDYDEKV